MSINPRQIDIDDSGDNLSGTPHNNAWLQAFQDKIDKALGVVLTFDATTGTVNNWALNPAHAEDRCVMWSGTATLTITGIAGGLPGDRLTIKNTNATGPTGARIFLPMQASGSLAANQFYNVVQSAPTPIGPAGWVTYVYHGGIWVLVEHNQGTPISYPFNAGNFYSNGGGPWNVVVGNLTNLVSYLSGRMLTVVVTIEGTTLTAAGATYLAVYTAAYGGFSCQALTLCSTVDSAGVVESGFAQLSPTYGLDRIAIFRPGAVAWPSGAVAIYFTITFPVV